MTPILHNAHHSANSKEETDIPSPRCQDQRMWAGNNTSVQQSPNLLQNRRGSSPDSSQNIPESKRTFDFGLVLVQLFNTTMLLLIMEGMNPEKKKHPPGALDLARKRIVLAFGNKSFSLNINSSWVLCPGHELQAPEFFPYSPTNNFRAGQRSPPQATFFPRVGGGVLGASPLMSSVASGHFDRF